MKPSDPKKLHETLLRDLTDLKLLRIAATYAEVLDAAARKGCSTLEVLAELVGSEAAARQERSLERRIKRAHLPQRKTLEQYDFSFPKRIPKQAVLSRRAGIRLRLHPPAGLGRSGRKDRNWKVTPRECVGLCRL